MSRYWNVKKDQQTKRIKFTLRGLDLAAFRTKLVEKFEVEEESLNVIHYVMVGVQDVLTITREDDLIELVEELCDDEADAKLVHFIINLQANEDRGDNGNGNGRNQGNRNYIMNTMVKLALNAIPYTFNGADNENIHHFKENMRVYCSKNAIDDAVLIKLLHNGTILKGAAFKYLQKKEINLDDADDDAARLEIIWADLEKNYFKPNQVLVYKQKLQTFKQGTKKVKDYLTEFKEIISELELEIKIQRGKGCVYQMVGVYELAAWFITGLNKKIAELVGKAAYKEHKTTNIDMQQLEEILVEAMEIDIFMMGLDINNKQSINSMVQMEEEKKEEIWDENKRLKAQINALNVRKYGNYGKPREYGKYNNDTNGGSYGSKGGKNGTGRFTNGKKANKGFVPRCEHGIKCRYGLDCGFWHYRSELDTFRQENRRKKSYDNGRFNNNNKPNNVPQFDKTRRINVLNVADPLSNNSIEIDESSEQELDF